MEYLKHSCGKPEKRWIIAFRHEFAELIYLRELDPDSDSYKPKSTTYLPSSDVDVCDICSMVLTDISCSECDMVLQAIMCASCKQGKLLD